MQRRLLVACDQLYHPVFVVQPQVHFYPQRGTLLSLPLAHNSDVSDLSCVASVQNFVHLLVTTCTLYVGRSASMVHSVAASYVACSMALCVRVRYSSGTN